MPFVRLVLKYHFCNKSRTTRPIELKHFTHIPLSFLKKTAYRLVPNNVLSFLRINKSHKVVPLCKIKSSFFRDGNVFLHFSSHSAGKSTSGSR
jgi:hypothetical protein